MSDTINATLTGIVKETFTASTGGALVLELRRENAKYPDKVTVWGIDGQYEIGDKVKVTGQLSWGSKTADNGKRYFNVNINQAEVHTIKEEALI